MSETKTLENNSGLDKVFNIAAILVAVVLTIFHLLAASPLLTLNNTTQAVIHGTLVVTFFLLMRPLKFRKVSRVLDVVLIVLTFLAAYQVIVMRNSNTASGVLYSPYQRAISIIFVGVALIVAYRALGKILPTLSLIFLIYTLVGRYLPMPFTTARVTILRMGTYLTVDTENGDNFPIHVASYSFQADGYVMVIDGKAYEGRAYFGDLIMGACQAVGFEGMVVDGCTRDRDGNIELDFPVYSRGFMPRGPIKKNEGNINTPIMCGGVKVNPGDLVVGDSVGVCVIPVEHIETVLAEAEKKQAYETKREETIAACRKARADGGELPQLAPQWVLDMMK